MKENIRKTESKDELSENSGMHKFEKNIFLFCMYKTIKISRETWGKMM